MQTDSTSSTSRGPQEWFTGDVWIDTVTQPHDEWLVNVGIVHFSPGARTAWHSHQGGQTLFVMEGRGLVQSRGGEAVELRPGDSYFTPNGTQHWHGAERDHLMSHMSITQGPATWGEHVSDDEYRR
jgi:quercetin dioxygenase-like cupin family protein